MLFLFFPRGLLRVQKLLSRCSACAPRCVTSHRTPRSHTTGIDRGARVCRSKRMKCAFLVRVRLVKLSSWSCLGFVSTKPLKWKVFKPTLDRSTYGCGAESRLKDRFPQGLPARQCGAICKPSRHYRLTSVTFQFCNGRAMRYLIPETNFTLQQPSTPASLH